jgi:hypothetical protein
MYEFEAVSVSSFEAASLAATLTERSADGWDVVSIVPAGSDVIAYLRRSTGAATAVDAELATSDADTAAASDVSGEKPAVDLLTPAKDSESPAQPVGAGTGSSGAGWGASGDTGSTGASSWTGGDSGGGAWSGSGTDASSWGGSAQQPPPTPPTPSVPAGWYADPAGRFELRYWDGNAWTEHVSRGGQQYTDPPVA